MAIGRQPSGETVEPVATSRYGPVSAAYRKKAGDIISEFPATSGIRTLETRGNVTHCIAVGLGNACAGHELDRSRSTPVGPRYSRTECRSRSFRWNVLRFSELMMGSIPYSMRNFAGCGLRRPPNRTTHE